MSHPLEKSMRDVCSAGRYTCSKRQGHMAASVRDWSQIMAHFYVLLQGSLVVKAASRIFSEYRTNITILSAKECGLYLGSNWRRPFIRLLERWHYSTFDRKGVRFTFRSYSRSSEMYDFRHEINASACSFCKYFQCQTNFSNRCTQAASVENASNDNGSSRKIMAKSAGLSAV